MRLINLDKMVTIHDEDNNAVIFGKLDTAAVEAIPIEWLKSHLPNMDDYILMKGYPMFDEDNPLNMAYDKGYSNGWKACCKAIVTDLLADWKEENSN